MKIDDKNDLVKSVTDKQPESNNDVVLEPQISYAIQSPNIADNLKQNQLFSLQDELSAIDPDSLTPKQAHDLLYHLKKIISH